MPSATRPISARDEATAARKTVVAAHAAAVAARDEAAGGIASEVEGIAAQERVITERKNELREAVAMSQLHSFTAMVFGKDPLEVSDAEIHWFLRFFVFLPAIMISIASTLLAVTAYRRVPARKPRQGPLEIDRTKTLERHIELIVNASLSRRRSGGSQCQHHPSLVQKRSLNHERA